MSRCGGRWISISLVWYVFYYLPLFFCSDPSGSPSLILLTLFQFQIDVTRKSLEEMRSQSPPGGVIQQVTSIGGQRGVPYFSLYCASKWAVEGMTEAISHELKPEWNIKLNIIEPGGTCFSLSPSSIQLLITTHCTFSMPPISYSPLPLRPSLKPVNSSTLTERSP